MIILSREIGWLGMGWVIGVSSNECCTGLTHAAPAHPCVIQRANLRGTAPAHPCARGVPFILNITVHPVHKKPHRFGGGVKSGLGKGKITDTLVR